MMILELLDPLSISVPMKLHSQSALLLLHTVQVCAMFFYESDDVSFDFCRGLAIPFSKSPKWFQFRASTLFAIPV